MAGNSSRRIRAAEGAAEIGATAKPAGARRSGRRRTGAPAVQPSPPLTYSKWTKLCERSAETKSRLMCRTGRDGRLDNGVPLVAAVLIEVEGEPKKVLQVTLPAGVMLPRGTRVHDRQ